MATITQITSSTVTAGVVGNTAYTLYTSTSASSGFSTTGISFTTPTGANTYTFTYSPTSKTYLSIAVSGQSPPTPGVLYTNNTSVVGTSSRLANITNVSSGTTLNVDCSATTTFYNLTSASLNSLSMVGPDPTESGTYFVLRNNVPNTYLSLSPSGSGAPVASVVGIPVPLVIPPGTSANLVWNGSGYTMF